MTADKTSDTTVAELPKLPAPDQPDDQVIATLMLWVGSDAQLVIDLCNAVSTTLDSDDLILTRNQEGAIRRHLDAIVASREARSDRDEPALYAAIERAAEKFYS